MLRSKFTKFLLFLKQQIGFSSNCASRFSAMRHKSSVLFLVDILYTFNKRSLLHITHLIKFHVISQKCENDLILILLFGPVFPNDIKFQLKKRGKVISHGTEE